MYYDLKTKWRCHRIELGRIKSKLISQLNAFSTIENKIKEDNTLNFIKLQQVRENLKLADVIQNKKIKSKFIKYYRIKFLNIITYFISVLHSF